MKSVSCSQPGYASITCSKISNIPKNLICIAKFNDSSILISIISCDCLNLSLVNKYVDDVTIPTQVIKYNQIFTRRISQSDCSIHIKLNYSLNNCHKCNSHTMTNSYGNICNRAKKKHIIGNEIEFDFVYLSDFCNT